MNRIELRAAARKLNRLHQRFAGHFGRREACEHSRTYLRGLLLAEGRKSAEPMALCFAPRATDQAPTQCEALALQRFLTLSPWEATAVQRELQQVFAEEFVPSAVEWPLGTVAVIDESSFLKQGTKSVGVMRQWCGRLGHVANCQTGVFLIGVTPAGTALLEHQLFLPEEWVKDPVRRKKTRVPKTLHFQTKPQIATTLVERTLANGAVRFDWIVADEEYGRNGQLLNALEAHRLRYVMEVPNNISFLTQPPRTRVLDGSQRLARDLAAALPEDAWRTLTLREGAKGPLVFQFARLRVWAVRHGRSGPPCWLIFQRPLHADGELKYWVSNAAEDVSLETLALVTGTRCRVEEFFEDAKGLLGMTDYEARSWTSWHHHMSLVALAHLYVTQVKRDVRRDIPEFTLEMAFRLVKTALDRPVLGPEDTLQLIEYHLQRNRVARNSHRNTWLRKHNYPDIKPLL